MDAEEYRRVGKEMVDYIADYLENIRERKVFPAVQPGYIRELIPESAPEEGEPWKDIFRDVERVIMPGMTHWQSPYMHAYFPALNSFPSMLGDMLADAINCICFTWASAPAATELESTVMDWLAKALDLPEKFLHFPPPLADGKPRKALGGGVIQTTASEATYISLMAARTDAFRRYKQKYGKKHNDSEINALLVGYTSIQAHSSVEKASYMGLVKVRFLDADENFSLRGETLRKAIEVDKEAGLIPFYVCATLGTTGCCAFDNLKEIGPICESEKLWLHLDSAYAGTALFCPEYRYFMEGSEYATSFAFNPSKWMMVNFDCTAMWVSDAYSVHSTFNVNPLYLKHENTGSAIDYMHWHIGLSRRFRSLKLWFVLRSYGIKGIQAHVRHNVCLAEKFEKMVKQNRLFEVPAKRYLGMVVFRLKGENELTEKLLKTLNSSGKIHMVPANLCGKYIIRYTVTSQRTTTEDIDRDWAIIQNVAQDVLESQKLIQQVMVPASIAAALPMEKKFGTSMLLSNTPYTPPIMNGSYAAIIDDPETAREFARAFAKQLKRIHATGLAGTHKMSKRRAWAMGQQMSAWLKNNKITHVNLIFCLDSRMEVIVDQIRAYLPQLEEQYSSEEDSDPADAARNDSPKRAAQRGRALSVDCEHKGDTSDPVDLYALNEKSEKLEEAADVESVRQKLGNKATAFED